MYERITESSFIRKFEEHNRLEEFSLRGLEALFDYLSEKEAGTGQDIELDVIGLCCEFSDYDSALEALSDVDLDHWAYLTDEYSVEIAEERALTELRDNCVTVIEHEDGVIISE